MTQFDMFIHVLEINEDMHFKWRYRKDIFKKDTVQRLAEHFIYLLDEITKRWIYHYKIFR